MFSNINSYYLVLNNPRLNQGDILVDYDYPFWIELKKEDPQNARVKTRKIPYMVILSQDCDLEQDLAGRNLEKPNHDKYLQSVLVCPCYPSEMLKAGEHIGGLSMQKITGDTAWNHIITNSNPRYHTLKKYESDKIAVPELVVDFKHYYTIPREGLYSSIKEHYKCTLNLLFRESLSQRFAYYLSRIALPELNFKKMETEEGSNRLKDYKLQSNLTRI